MGLCILVGCNELMNEELSPQAYEELLGHTVDVLTVLDDDGTIQYESLSITHVLGYDPAELVGKNVFEFIHPDDQQKAVETFRNVVDADEAYTSGGVELRFKHNDGSWVWLESRGSNQTATAIGGYVITSREISARREAEQQLQRERDRLERFAGVVSHDLRNPLNVIEGRVELAQEDCDSEHLDAIERTVDRMNNLIEDLLTVAREGNADPVVDAVSLRNIADASWQTVETEDAELRIQTDRIILADEHRLQQLFENLFRNSIDHGGEDVTITVGEVDDGFYVADDGQGLPDEPRESLLNYGFSTKSDGTGFGLSIVTEIAENHGWQLNIADAEGGGARFEIRNVTFE